MRLYIDLSCFNRPFDDQGQERIRLETEAVLSVLTRVLEGRDLLLWSWAMSYENDKHPKTDRGRCPEMRDRVRDSRLVGGTRKDKG